MVSRSCNVLCLHVCLWMIFNRCLYSLPSASNNYWCVVPKGFLFCPCLAGKRKGFKSVTIVEHRNNLLLIHRRLVTDVFFILCLGIIIMGKCLLFSFSDFFIISPFQDELFSCIPYNLVWEPFYIFLSRVSHFCAVSCDGLALF